MGLIIQSVVMSRLFMSWYRLRFFRDGFSQPRLAVNRRACEDALVYRITWRATHRFRIFSVALVGAAWLEMSVISADSLRSFFSTAFPNGVASGDVDATSVVLWARASKTGAVSFAYSIHSDLLPTSGVLNSTVVDPNRPAKVEIHGLEPYTQYFFRVTDSGGESLDGRFRTLSTPGTFRGLRFGVSGDWQGQLAPFSSVADASERDLDFFVALGDTIYADVPSPAVPGGPAHLLEEFRAKHAEILSERMGLNVMARLRATTALYATVDDHEWTNGISGGVPVELGKNPEDPVGIRTVSQTPFFQTGLQAFLEYQPVAEPVYQAPEDPRTDGRARLYRARRFGSDAALFLLDARSFRDAGLTSPVSPFDINERARFESISLERDPTTGAALPHRTLLGLTQFSTLIQDLLQAEAEGVIWKFVLIPEPIQNLGFAGAGDRYEGYAAERRELLRRIHTAPIANVVFVSADLHGTLINNVTYRLEPGGTNIDSGAFEIITGAVAHDKPFGPTALDYASGVKVTPDVSLLQLLLKFLGVPDRATFNSLPLAERDRLLEGVANLFLSAAELDLLGFSGSDIDVRWDLGGPVAVHSYGWTEFEIDRDTHELLVTTRGVPGYSIEDLSPELVSRMPEILNRFRVRPRSVSTAIPVRIQIRPDGLAIIWRGNAVLESRDSMDRNARWQLAPEPIETVDADFLVRVNVSDHPRFFRVRPRSP